MSIVGIPSLPASLTQHNDSRPFHPLANLADDDDAAVDAGGGGGGAGAGAGAGGGGESGGDGGRGAEESTEDHTPPATPGSAAADECRDDHDDADVDTGMRARAGEGGGGDGVAGGFMAEQWRREALIRRLYQIADKADETLMLSAEGGGESGVGSETALTWLLRPQASFTRQTKSLYSRLPRPLCKAV